jgi:8-oxo-dGTP diphosphatase
MNIRVYGLLMSSQNEVLVTDEYRFGMKFTKFPGGGLEPGEGTIDCIKREAVEEMFQEIEVIDHFYTTDFYQESAFKKGEQIVSIYYRIQTIEPLKLPIKTKRFDFDVLEEEAQIFRWLSIEQLTKDDFNFPIDKVVAGLLKEKFC